MPAESVAHSPPEACPSAAASSADGSSFCVRSEVPNFTGTWRLRKSDSLWFMCKKLGCPLYVRPFVDSSWLSLITMVDHRPKDNVFIETMVKARLMSFKNEVRTDGSVEIWPSTFDPNVHVNVTSFCMSDGAIVTVMEHVKQRAVQRLTRRMDKEENSVLITNVFSYVVDGDDIETKVYRSWFDRD